MREITVRKIGDSLGIVLPDEVIRALRLKDGESVALLETESGAFEIAPSDPDFANRMERVKVIMSRYDQTLRDLAK